MLGHMKLVCLLLTRTNLFLRLGQGGWVTRTYSRWTFQSQNPFKSGVPRVGPGMSQTHTHPNEGCFVQVGEQAQWYPLVLCE